MEVLALGVFFVEEMFCGNIVGYDGEILVVLKVFFSVQQSLKEILELSFLAFGSVFFEVLGTVSFVFLLVIGRKEEELYVVFQSGFVGILYCYIGIREAGGGDIEVEESEVFSCSEGENEFEVAVGSGQ